MTHVGRLSVYLSIFALLLAQHDIRRSIRIDSDAHSETYADKNIYRDETGSRCFFCTEGSKRKMRIRRGEDAIIKERGGHRNT